MLVDQPHRKLEWQSNPGSPARVGDRDGCFRDRMGCLLQWGVYRRMLVTRRATVAHQCSGVDCSNIWGASFLQIPASEVSAAEDRQYHCGCICKQDGWYKIPFLMELARDLWQWCLQRGIHLMAHLAGKLNFTADILSHHLRDHSDRILNEEIFSTINKKLGPLDIDLFTVSWRPDPKAEATDAFLQDWSAYKGYAHPPWCLISRVLF